MGKELERRSYNFEVRAEKRDDGHAIITGRPIVYDSRTDLGIFDEIITAGALKNTDLTDVRFLVNHDVSKIPLARSRRNNDNSTMKLSVDDKGLNLDWVKLDVENNSEARALYSAVERGDITGMSFMFAIRGEEWDDLDTEHPTRRITDISTVVEVSAVTFPAYDSTEISTRSEKALENARRALENARTRSETTPDGDDKNTLELLKLKNEILGGI